jgi:adenylate cyclase
MTAEKIKRKLAAILSADVKGYSRLMGEDEIATVRTLEAYRETISMLIERHHGRVVDSPGDNLLAEFASIVDAVEGAVDIQKALKAKNANLPEKRRMEFRIGINLGDIIEEEERIYGDGINIAARMQGLADGGGISISGTAYDQVKNKLALEYEFQGEQTVKNIEEPVRVYRVVMESDVFTNGTDRALELPDRPSVAVLPFANMTGDPKEEYFSDGLTEDLITDLSKISGLFVIARNSVFTYKGKTVKVEEVGRELGVRYVLEGSVRKDDKRVRITAQLVDATTGGHIWAERYDRQMKNIFALQDEVTRKIIAALAVKLTEDELKLLERNETENLEAYKYVLRGGKHLNRFQKESNTKARQMFERAVDLDPNYASAYLGLSIAHMTDWTLGWNQNPKTLETAFEMAQKAIALNDALPEAHAILSHVYLWKKQHERAIEEAEKAIAIGPNQADCYATLATVLIWVGRLEEAVELVKKAMRLNPYHPEWYLFRLGQAYGFMGHYEKAIEASKKVLIHNAHFLPARIFLASAYGQAGQKEKARAEVTELLKLNPSYSLAIAKDTIPIKDQRKLDEILKTLREAGLK